MNILVLSQAYGCTTSGCDGLNYGSCRYYDCTRCNVTNHHTVKQGPGDCIEKQEALKAHYSIESSGLGHGYPNNGQNPENNQPIAINWQ